MQSPSTTARRAPYERHENRASARPTSCAVRRRRAFGFGPIRARRRVLRSNADWVGHRSNTQVEFALRVFAFLCTD
jgi:hypothetical protein